MSIFLICNPGSRSGRSAALIKKITGLLTSRHVKFTAQLTNHLDDAERLSKEANHKGYEKVIAVGGDGTINKVINGFYDQHGHRLSPASFGVIYTGTSPDFCKSYDIPLKPERAIETIIAGRLRRIPIGRVEHAGYGDDPKIRYFACCANIGLGADLAREANAGIRGAIGDFFGTFFSLLKVVIRFKSVPIRLESESLPSRRLENLWNLSIGLTPFIASGIRVHSDYVSDSRQFYIMQIANLKIRDLPGIFQKIYGGKILLNDEKLSITKSSSLKISSEGQAVEIEYDGDPQGFLPASFTLVPEPLEVITR